MSATPGYEPEIPVPADAIPVPGGSPFRAPATAIPVPGAPASIPVPASAIPVPGIPAPELNAPELQGQAAPYPGIDPYTPPPSPAPTPAVVADPFAQAAATVLAPTEPQDKLFRPGSRQDMAARGLYNAPTGENPHADLLHAVGVKHIPAAYTHDQVYGTTTGSGRYTLLARAAAVMMASAAAALLVPVARDANAVMAAMKADGSELTLLIGPSMTVTNNAVIAAGWPLALLLFAVLHAVSARAIRQGTRGALLGMRMLAASWLIAAGISQTAGAPAVASAACGALGAAMVALSFTGAVRDWCSRVMA